MLSLQDAYRDGRLSKLDYAYAACDKLGVLNEIPPLLSRSELESITVTDSHVVFTFKGSGLRMACDPADRGNPSVVTLLFGLYEKAEIETFLAMVQPGACFLDIGANQGWFGLQVAKKDPANRVYCFEPVPPTYGYLTRNIQENRLTNIQAWNFGLMDEEGERTFALDPLHMGAASLGISEGPTQVTCQFRTLDAVAAENGLAPDLIKADVEGAEIFVLKGGRETLEKYRPVLFLEMLRKHARMFGYHPNDIIALLQPLGYRCFTLADRMLRPFDTMTEETVETNFFFLHPERHAALLQRFARA